MTSTSVPVSPPASLPGRTWVLILAAVVPVFVVLFGFVPYTYSHLEYGAALVPVAQALWFMWQAFPDYQFGMIVPLLVGYLVYRQRRDLAALPIRGWWPAVILVAGVLVLYWAGRRVDNQYIGFFSIQLLLISLVLWLLGWRWLRALAFPLAFLVFAWPMPFLDNLVTFPLRMLMSNMAAGVLETLGLPVEQNGTGIFSAATVNMPAGERFRVDVADPCSGIRSLYALMMVSALYGYFALQKPWQRGVLFVCAVPLAILGNLFRILLLTFGIILLGSPVAIGTLEKPSLFHEGAGYAVFLVALAGMIGICALFNLPPGAIRRGFKALSTRSTPRNATAGTASADVAPDVY